MHSVLLERRAEKDLSALDGSLKRKIVERLLVLKTVPRPQSVKKLTGTKSAWRIRIGDWRILYEVDDKKKEIRIYRIKHRSKAY